MHAPFAGRYYPGSLPELRTWFRSDDDCVDYLDWLRWPDGFVGPWRARVGDWSAWPAYTAAAASAGVTHEAHNVSASGQPAHVSLPGVHRLFSLTKRVLDGTHQGSAQPEPLQAYLDEFVFRFNRRRSNERGMLFFRLLEAAVAGSPAPYKDIVAIHGKPLIVPIPPRTPRDRPRTLIGLPIDRPWRTDRTP